MPSEGAIYREAAPQFGTLVRPETSPPVFVDIKTPVLEVGRLE